MTNNESLAREIANRLMTRTLSAAFLHASSGFQKKVSLLVFYFRSLLVSDFASGMTQYQHRALRLFSRLHLLTILHQHSGTHFCASIMAPQMMTRGYLIMPLISPLQPTVRTPYFMQLKAFSVGLTAFFRWVHFIRKLKNTATLRTEISGSITLT